LQLSILKRIQRYQKSEYERLNSEVQRQVDLLKTGALQTAILNSENFSSIATDDRGVIQIFNIGAERMLGYAAGDVLSKITPADIPDPSEIVLRAQALSTDNTGQAGRPFSPLPAFVATFPGRRV